MLDPGPTQRLRLIGALHRTQIYWRTPNRLSRQIQEMTGTRIDRHKLKSLLAYENRSLSVDEFAAFDIFLTPFGESLADKPMFEPRGVLPEMARSGGIAFLLASDPIQNLRKIDISHWDVRSMIEVMRPVQDYGPLQIDLDEVVYLSGDEPSGSTYRKEGWYRKLTGQPQSMVSIGSPRVARASEIMLAEMFSIDPFTPQGQDDPDLPFRFFWPKKQSYFPSSFVCEQPETSNAPDGKEPRVRGAMGLRLGERLLTVPPRRDWPTSYGIIAAQRRVSGQIRLVVAGLQGPSTLAAARAVSSLSAAIPDAPRNRDSPVLWAVVEAKIKADKARGGESRLVHGHRIAHGPHIWSGA